MRSATAVALASSRTHGQAAISSSMPFADKRDTCGSTALLEPTRLVVMCEAAGMVPQLARTVDWCGISVISSGGFESVTEKHAFAVELANEDRPTEVLHIGDHDPSGAHLFLAVAEDVQAFAADLGGDVTFTRLPQPDRSAGPGNLATKSYRSARLRRTNLPS
jgi:hypothetical protein